MELIQWKPFSLKHKLYIHNGVDSEINIAEGAVRAGKTIDNCIIAREHLEWCEDKIHLASGSTLANAKLNIGECNGFGLEHQFKGRCHWGKFKENEALYIDTKTGEKVVLFAGGGKADSYKKILGNSYGLWIATEINEHYDCDDSRTSFIKVAMARQLASAQIKKLWDLNPDSPKARIYVDYIDKWRDMGICNYAHFTINDNLSITEERKQAIIQQYDRNSIWYRRDILGERVIAEGLIYRQFADNVDKYLFSKRYDEDKKQDVDDLPFSFNHVNIGVDFGGTKSGHAFVCTGITRDNEVYPLLSRKCSGNTTDVELRQIAREFVEEFEFLYPQYHISFIFCDSAETVLVKSIRDELRGYTVKNARKDEVLKRIRKTQILLNTGKLKMNPQCDSLIDALSTAQWNPKKDEWERLDDGTSDIDTLDAFEYTWERFI